MLGRLTLISALRRLRRTAPVDEFHSYHYLRHNQRRQEHLATLGLPLAGRSVLELGAGIGDHSSFFLDRGCSVTITDARDENLAVLRGRYPELRVRHLDMDAPDPAFVERFDIVYCYGLLYHLVRPAEALDFVAARCRGMLLLETCVTPGEDVALNPAREAQHRPTQAVSGVGCRPTRPWIMAELSRHFPNVYVTRTQPWHEEFPLDWSLPPAHYRLTRSVFVASRGALETPLLLETLQSQQVREYPGSSPTLAGTG